MSTAQPQLTSCASHNRPAKRAVNLGLSVDVLEAAKSLHINVPRICDTYLRGVMQQVQSRRWQAEHSEFISANNVTCETERLPAGNTQYGAVPKRVRETSVASLAPEQDQIMGAPDFLFHGY